MQLPILLPQLGGLQPAAARRHDMHMGSMMCSCPSLWPDPGGIVARRGVTVLQLVGAVAGSSIVPLDVLQVQRLQLTTNK